MKLGLLLVLTLAAAPFQARALAQDSRQKTQLAEDQALLKRQLQRLKSTMEVLATRFEAEGRTHAAKLLRGGLAHLDERAADLGSKTLEELMSIATTTLEQGQTVQSVENQEAVIKSLEKLYAILTDRAGLEDLQKSLDELKKVQAELTALADREQQLQKDTAGLRQSAATPEQKSLDQALQKAIEEQRELLAKTQAESRAQNQLELDEIQRALAQLQARQQADQGVLSAWKPEEKAALDKAQPSIDKAAESATRAQRLAQAANELKAAARSARKENGDLQAAERDLEHAAEREDRHERAAQDPAAKKASEALSKGAETLKKTTNDAESRANAAKDLEARAQELEDAARAENAASRAAGAEAEKELAQVKTKDSAAGQAAESVKKSLAEAAKASEAAQNSSDEKNPPADSGQSPSPDNLAKKLAESERAANQAQHDLQKGLKDLATIKPALSQSQTASSQEAERLARATQSIPQGGSPEAKQAQAKLDSAAAAQKQAAEAAAQEHAPEAAAKAAEAAKALAEASQALSKLADQAAAQRAETPEAKALAEAQKALAQKAAELEKQASQAGLPQKSGEQASKSMSQAKQAMQKAAEQLSKGQNSEAAEAQQDALSKMQEAQEAAKQSGAPSKPEDKQKAQELAAEQEKIRQELLDLAKRNQKRDTAQPTPSLDEAGQKASDAKQDLDEGDLDEAGKNEEKTEKKMREALDKLGKEEEQYQKLRQEELLFKIAEQVRSLTEEHRAAMKDTLEIDQQRKPGDKATHTQRLRLRKVSKTEEALAGRSGEIAKAILAEQSVVFAELLDQAQKDLTRISRDLGEQGDYQSGERVQVLQQDVEQSLVWLAEALQQEKDRRKKENQDQEQQKDKNQRPQNRLVPDVAELKLLRRMEVDILDSVDQMRAIHPEIVEGKEVDPILLEDIARLAHRHQRTSDLFQQFRKRLGLPDPEPQQDHQ
jgi:hypothetical protein